MQTIVIADDSRTIRRQLRRALTDDGYRVVEAETGVEAVQQICNNQPMLAILDINMPELDGYGVCQLLGEMGTPWSELPIVFLTSQESHALEVLGRQMGAYLKKPVAAETVLDTIRTFVAVAV